MQHQDLQALNIKVQDIRFRKEDSGWCILVTDQGTCKGVVKWKPAVGEGLTVHGWWAQSDFSGKDEFSFTSAIPYMPSNPIDLLEYAAEKTLGVGQAMKMDIWAKWNNDWFEKSEGLEGIARVTDAIREAWRETLQDMRLMETQTETIAFLMSSNCTVRMAEVAWAEWGVKTIAVVKEDPYSLSYLPNFGFAVVDEKIRQTFNIGDDDPRRHDAAVNYCLAQLLNDGGTLVAWFNLLESVKDLIPNMDFAASVMRLAEKKRIVLVDDSRWIARMNHYKAEETIWKRFGPAGFAHSGNQPGAASGSHSPPSCLAGPTNLPDTRVAVME